MDLGRMRTVGRAAALAGAEVVKIGRAPAEGEAKGLPGDWVTEVDVAAEVAIEALLRAETPDVAVQGEESGGATSGLRWVVDPLDGTTNFLHGFWAVGVSVALVEEETPVAAAIAAPGRSGSHPTRPHAPPGSRSGRSIARWSAPASRSGSRIASRATSRRSRLRCNASRTSGAP